MPEQQEDLATWKALLWSAPVAHRPVFHVLVATSEPAGTTPLGFVSAEFFRHSSVGLLTYLAVAAAYRRQGLGRRLVQQAKTVLREDAARQGTLLRAIFGEVNDPRGGPTSDGESPTEKRARVVALAKLGARRVPVRYVQPQLRPGAGRSYSLMLVAFPPNGTAMTHLPSDVIRDFLREFYRSLGVDDPERDDDFRAAAEGLTEPCVALAPLEGESAGVAE
ncbi:MAG: GNAT family N-acetyltransferase [Armatimonadota bacterium]|nr:GNAT family N-acetyltransferase [Armatimonadota bacterium]MDR7512347.1 GNAT family N-acetyltransferase [Armatimonadota bacterium]